jgi:hypothetical protein
MRTLLTGFALVALTLGTTLASVTPAHAAATNAQSAPALSARPTRIKAVYDLYRNGQKLGQVNDALRVEGDRYTLESVATPSGPLALIWRGTLRSESAGTLTAQGLRPSRYVQRRSDRPARDAEVEFDWKARALDYDARGKRWRDTGLADGAQDQISQLYQFAYLARQPGDFALQVVGAKKAQDYRYVARNGGTLDTPLGAFATRHYARVANADDDKSVDVWIARGLHHLPLRVRIVEDGVTLEQRLVSLAVD